mgnify:CR=1 FL=1
MNGVKAQPLKIANSGGYAPCEVSDASHVCLNLPGPIPTRIVPVQIKGTRKGTGNWTWNGSMRSPTLRPSVLTKHPQPDGTLVCHSWITDGKVQFLADCSHELAGQTLDLFDVDW